MSSKNFLLSLIKHGKPLVWVEKIDIIKDICLPFFSLMSCFIQIDIHIQGDFVLISGYEFRCLGNSFHQISLNNICLYCGMNRKPNCFQARLTFHVLTNFYVQVWPTRRLIMMLRPYCRCGTSLTSCPSAMKTPPPSGSARTLGKKFCTKTV